LPDTALASGGFVQLSAGGDVTRLASAARLMPLDELWERARSRDPAVVMLALLGAAALVGCTLNLTRLLMAKLLSNTAGASIRRALGARRLDLFAIQLFEAVLVGAAAVLLALGLSWLGARAFNTLLPMRPADYALSVRLAGIDLGVAAAAGLIAGFWPAVQASRVAPATQLAQSRSI
jgi:putative ABC transport system permease protein